MFVVLVKLDVSFVVKVAAERKSKKSGGKAPCFPAVVVFGFFWFPLTGQDSEATLLRATLHIKPIQKQTEGVLGRRRRSIFTLIRVRVLGRKRSSQSASSGEAAPSFRCFQVENMKTQRSGYLLTAGFADFFMVRTGRARVDNFGARRLSLTT